MADGVGNGAKDAERSGVHHQVGELEHGFREALGEGENGAALGLRNERERHGKEDAEDDDLKHLAFGDGFGDILRKDVGDELRGGVGRNIEGLRRGGGGEMDAFSCAADMDSRIADEHRKRRDDFKVDQGFEAEAADFLQVGVAGDAHDENAEEQRRDDHLDEPEKNGAEELQLYCDGGPVLPKLCAGEQADEDPSCQRAAGCGIGGDEKDYEPAQER